MSSIAHVKSLDHLVLTVVDLEATLKFYVQILGMQHTAFSSESEPEITRHALKFGHQKINIHVRGYEFEPKAQVVQPGSADLCFLIEERVDDVRDKLRSNGFRILEEGKVVNRTGAQGRLRSIYIRDPDGNLIELSNLE